MDIFKNEETRVAEKIDAVIPQFEEIAQRGRIIAKELHEVKNALKYPKALGHNLFGSELCAKDVSQKLEEVKNELDGYAEKSKAVIDDVTKILTEIRYSPMYIPS
jgi:hypothetical protein